MDLDQTRKNLPIFEIRSKLITEIQRNATIVLLGETGCGKTTQIPQYIYESHPQMKGMIACTQPRRVAAITVAQRVAQEMNTELGTLVGYCVRFEDVSAPETRIKYMTDGMLLREAIGDPLLTRYSVIILDEVHERTIHTDCLLGIIKAVQAARANSIKTAQLTLRPLKVILMSATMNVDEFSAYFNKAPVFFLEGRQFQVDVFHAEKPQSDYMFSAISTVLQLHRTTPLDHDILVFMTGQEEIDATVKTLNELNKSSNMQNGRAKHANNNNSAEQQQQQRQQLPMLVLPLYSALPQNKQLRVFERAPSGCRKVIISTNVAETSITIKGIKFVVDTGKIKAKLYTPQVGIEILKVYNISKSQAWQRTGRAGRESSGTCYRLFTEDEFDKFADNTVPEIMRSNLLSVVLQLTALGIRDLLAFDFMSKPADESINAALADLEMLGAIRKLGESNGVGKPTLISESVNDDAHSSVAKKKRLPGNATFKYGLTEIGKRMAQFPLDPRLARALIAAEKLACVEDVMKIVSMLSVDHVFHNTSNIANASKREQAQAIRHKFVSADGDHITLLNVYKSFMANKQSKEWCQENYLDFRNMKLAVETCKQLRGICNRNEMNLASSPANTVNIRRALISGMFVNSAEHFKDNEYKTVTTIISIIGRQVVQIHPSSALFNSKPSCVLFNELVKTNKTYMRDISVISSNWLLEANPTLFNSKVKNHNGFTV